MLKNKLNLNKGNGEKKRAPREKMTFYNMTKGEKKFVKIGFGILGGIIGGVLIIGIIGASQMDKMEKVEATPIKQVEQAINPKEIKRGTSEYVDAIYYYVKNEKGMISKVNEAWEWTKTNYPNYYKDMETMEKAIFYGNILDRFSNDETIKRVGMNLVQGTKYVYRGYKTVDSDHTKLNLEQIQKGIGEAINK